MSNSLKTVLFLITGILTIIIVWLTFSPKVNYTAKPKVATVLNPARELVNFNLIDSNNNSFNNNTLYKNWTLMFFGYTKCPSVCPATLKMMQTVWQKFPNGKPSDNSKFVFASLTPQNDPPEKLRKFLTNYSSDFLGVTGDPNELNNLTRFLGITSWDEHDPSTNEKVMAHSSNILLINPEGRLEAIFTPPYEPELLVNDLKILVKS
jgi:protein SCO1/2